MFLVELNIISSGEYLRDLEVCEQLNVLWGKVNIRLKQHIITDLRGI